MNTKDGKKERKLFLIWYEKRQTFHGICITIVQAIYKSQIKK